jgi:hypothetical protein
MSMEATSRKVAESRSYGDGLADVMIGIYNAGLARDSEQTWSVFINGLPNAALMLKMEGLSNQGY